MSDIKVIRILSDHHSATVHSRQAAFEKLYQARLEVQKLENMEKRCKENEVEAEAILNKYAPDWRDQLKKDFWKHY